MKRRSATSRLVAPAGDEGEDVGLSAGDAEGGERGRDGGGVAAALAGDRRAEVLEERAAPGRQGVVVVGLEGGEALPQPGDRVAPAVGVGGGGDEVTQVGAVVGVGGRGEPVVDLGEASPPPPRVRPARPAATASARRSTLRLTGVSTGRAGHLGAGGVAVVVEDRAEQRPLAGEHVGGARDGRAPGPSRRPCDRTAPGRSPATTWSRARTLPSARASTWWRSSPVASAASMAASAAGRSPSWACTNPCTRIAIARVDRPQRRDASSQRRAISKVSADLAPRLVERGELEVDDRRHRQRTGLHRQPPGVRRSRSAPASRTCRWCRAPAWRGPGGAGARPRWRCRGPAGTRPPRRRGPGRARRDRSPRAPRTPRPAGRSRGLRRGRTGRGRRRRRARPAHRGLGGQRIGPGEHGGVAVGQHAGGAGVGLGVVPPAGGQVGGAQHEVDVGPLARDRCRRASSSAPSAAARSVWPDCAHARSSTQSAASTRVAGRPSRGRGWPALRPRRASRRRARARRPRSHSVGGAVGVRQRRRPAARRGGTVRPAGPGRRPGARRALGRPGRLCSVGRARGQDGVTGEGMPEPEAGPLHVDELRTHRLPQELGGLVVVESRPRRRRGSSRSGGRAARRR